jgi:hypothetical protein
MIVTWILFVLTFMLGYILGTLRVEENREELSKRLGVTIRKGKRAILKERIGAIQKPSAEELAKRGTKLEETEQAIEDTLEDVL